jgi:DNA-binding transcriptional regulator YhcF (GntR family)
MSGELFDDTEKNRSLGSIQIYRSVMDHPLFKNRDPYSKREAWFDLLLEVNSEPAEVIIKGYKFIVGRGESIKSLDTWAIRWKWDKSKVRRFFSTLENEGMIALKNDTATDTVNDTVKNFKTTHITICKYDSYQCVRHTSKNENDTVNDTATDTKQYIYNNIYNNSLTNNSIGEEIFRKFKHLEISNNEVGKLKSIGYSQDQIDTVLNSIENHKKNTSYSSLYLTAINWLKRSHPEITYRSETGDKPMTDEEIEEYMRPKKPLTLL